MHVPVGTLCHLGLYAEFFWTFPIEHQLAVALSSPAATAAGFAFNRAPARVLPQLTPTSPCAVAATGPEARRTVKSASGR